MNVIILRTDIQSNRNVSHLRSLFNNHKGIFRWSVDTEDVDNVLRVEAEDTVEEGEIIEMLHSYGYEGEDLDEASNNLRSRASILLMM